MPQLLANVSTGQLAEILRYHVVPSKVMKSDISDGMEVVTQLGKVVYFEVDAQSKIRINGADLIGPGIECTNGVIYAINDLILPPS